MFCTSKQPYETGIFGFIGIRISEYIGISAAKTFIAATGID
jgi:hypothetical protein